MVTLAEEPADIFITDLETRDPQALAPDMECHEPEYWNRYELEVGEEGEGGATCYDQILSDEGRSEGWPHLEAYIVFQPGNSEFMQQREVQRDDKFSGGQDNTRDTEEGARILGTSEPYNPSQLREIPQVYDSDAPLNELFCQWNTQSTVGDVLRDFHWIIAYVLEGMQQYEAGMAPWPRLPTGFEQRVRSLNAEDIEGNISIASASRRVLSLLESTGIPQSGSRHGSVVARASRIPRLARKDSKLETAPEDEVIHVQSTVQKTGPTEAKQHVPPNNSRKYTASLGISSVTMPEEPNSASSTDTCLPRAFSWTDNETASTPRSPEKKGDSLFRVLDLGHTGSKIPILSSRPDGGNVPSIKEESVARKLNQKIIGSSPMRGRRGRIMAGEMQGCADLNLPRGRKVTRDNSPDMAPTSPTKTNSGEVTRVCRNEQENLLEDAEKAAGLDKENHRLIS